MLWREINKICVRQGWQNKKWMGKDFCMGLVGIWKKDKKKNGKNVVMKSWTYKTEQNEAKAVSLHGVAPPTPDKLGCRVYDRYDVTSIKGFASLLLDIPLQDEGMVHSGLFWAQEFIVTGMHTGLGGQSKWWRRVETLGGEYIQMQVSRWLTPIA